MSLKKEVESIYGNKLRIRVCGILVKRDAVLMVKHSAIGEKGFMWIPPGGGVVYGMSTIHNLEREFMEEVGLEINVQKLLFVSEFQNATLHAIEMFFKVERTSGVLTRGFDPEMDNGSQIIEEVKFMNFEEINKIDPKNKHNLFKHCNSIQELLNMSSFYFNN